MKNILLFTLFIFISCQAQNKQEFHLSISPAIDKIEIENKEIISIINDFLQHKNETSWENPYWVKSDEEKFIEPYQDIIGIEGSPRFGENYYQPSLMEIIKISDTQRLVKMAFIGVNEETNERFVRAIYNIMAQKENDDWKLKRATDYLTQDWQILKEGTIKYIIPPYRKPNREEIEKQKDDIQKISDFFETPPIEIITYYSCDTPKQILEIKGFDYLPNMYFGTTGGYADWGQIIYSGNQSEFYTHEIVHIYRNKLFPHLDSLLDEGIATYLGGSGKNDYAWHKAKFKEFLSQNPNIDLAEHLDPYERLYYQEETSIPYLTGALICEIIIKKHGKEKLLQIFQSKNDIWVELNKISLTKENLTAEIRKELEVK